MLCPVKTLLSENLKAVIVPPTTLTLCLGYEIAEIVQAYYPMSYHTSKVLTSHSVEVSCAIINVHLSKRPFFNNLLNSVLFFITHQPWKDNCPYRSVPRCSGKPVFSIVKPAVRNHSFCHSRQGVSQVGIYSHL